MVGPLEEIIFRAWWRQKLVPLTVDIKMILTWLRLFRHSQAKPSFSQAIEKPNEKNR